MESLVVDTVRMKSANAEFKSDANSERIECRAAVWKQQGNTTHSLYWHKYSVGTWSERTTGKMMRQQDVTFQFTQQWRRDKATD
jgi:hypothetical protein